MTVTETLAFHKDSYFEKNDEILWEPNNNDNEDDALCSFQVPPMVGSLSSGVEHPMFVMKRSPIGRVQ